MSFPDTIGRYRIVGPLAAGGMAEVFLGKLFGPSGFERPVVIKRVLPHLARSEKFVSMFTDEARIVSQIRHPNVVSVSEFGTDAGDLFLVMEYLEGESLDGLIRRMRSTGSTLDFALAAHIGAEICAGLHAAHELVDSTGGPLGLVHRDVSPQNVFVTYDGQVKVIDFGIAKSADRFTRTEAGDIKGKVAYMSPEQCRGETLDRRSDLFSLGIVLYELTTGRRLFARVNALMTIDAVCSRDPPDPAEIVPGYPSGLSQCMLRALERDRDKRFASAADMHRALLAVQRELGADTVPEEGLGAVMRKLFPDRIAEKRVLLQRVRAGDSVTDLPAAEVDVDVELPTVALQPQSTSSDRKRRGLVLLLAGTASVLALVVGAVWMLEAPAALHDKPGPAASSAGEGEKTPPVVGPEKTEPAPAPLTDLPTPVEKPDPPDKQSAEALVTPRPQVPQIKKARARRSQRTTKRLPKQPTGQPTEQPTDPRRKGIHRF